MAGTVVVTGCAGQEPLDGRALAGPVRELGGAGWRVVVVAAPGVASDAGGPGAVPAGELTLALGESRAGRRAVPVAAHVLIDPLDPALAGPSGSACPEPLAILEAEGISALVGSGFPVVIGRLVPVVPDGASYRPADAPLDAAACARRLACDLGSGVLAFVTGDDGPPVTGDIDHRDAEREVDPDPLRAEIGAAVRFLRAGGQLAVMTSASALPAALSSTADAVSAAGALRVHRTLARPRSDGPALAAVWC